MEKINKLFFIQKRFRIIFPASLLMLIIVFSILFIVNKRGDSNKTTENIPSPVITSTFRSTSDMVLDLNTAPQLPESLPLIMVEKSSLSNIENYSIAKNLGFIETPMITRDIRYGDIYIWKNNDYSLTINPKLSQYHLFSFTDLFTVNTMQELEEKDYLDKSNKFLNTLQPLNINALEINKIQYLSLAKPTGKFSVSNKDDFIIFEITYQLNSLNYTIVDQISPGTTGYLRLLKNGEVYEFFTTNISDVKVLEEKHKIKNLKEIEDSLDRAYVVSVDGYYGATSDLPKSDVASIFINSIEIVYLIDNNKQNLFQPVFLMKGKGYSKTLERDVFPTLYLPAYSE